MRPHPPTPPARRPSVPIGAPIGLGDGGPALPSEVVEHGVPNHRGAPVALHLLVGVEPREEPFIEGDLDRLHARSPHVDRRSTSSIDIRSARGRALDGRGTRSSRTRYGYSIP